MLGRHQRPCVSLGVSVTRPIYINTNLVGEDEIKSVDDLLDPKWKGKIVTSSLVQGYVYTPSTILREEKARNFSTNYSWNRSRRLCAIGASPWKR